MFFTIGDVLAFIAAFLGICFSSWAIVIASGLLFPARSEIAKVNLAASPTRTILRGLLIALLPGLFSVALIGNPFPLVKLVGWICLLALLSMGALGGSALGLIAGERLQKMDSNLTAYAAFCRGTGFIVTGAMLPILGWLAFAPLILFASLGAGFSAVRNLFAKPPVQTLETV